MNRQQIIGLTFTGLVSIISVGTLFQFLRGLQRPQTAAQPLVEG